MFFLYLKEGFKTAVGIKLVSFHLMISPHKGCCSAVVNRLTLQPKESGGHGLLAVRTPPL